MRKLLFVAICALILLPGLFATSAEPAAITAVGATGATVLFDLSKNQKMEVGFTTNADKVASTTAPGAGDLPSPANEFAITEIATVGSTNVGQRDSDAYVYWFLVGGINLEVNLLAEASMKTAGSTPKTLGLTTTSEAISNRGSSVVSSTSIATTGDPTPLFRQADNTEFAVNWGFSKLKFVTGDIAHASPEKYEAKLTLTVAVKE